MPEAVGQTSELEGRVLQCVTLPVQLSSLEGASWSTDYRLAFPTKKGVYVFEILPDAGKTTQKLSFLKTLLDNEQEPNPWQVASSVPEDVLPRLPRDTRNSLVMDRVMAPHTAGGELTYRQTCGVGWTPPLHPSAPCLLITLTADFRLRFHKQCDRNWETQIDLSEILFNYVKSIEKQEVKVEDLLLEEEMLLRRLVERAYMTATNCFCWRRKNAETSSNVMVTGQMSGHIVSYRVQGEAEVVVLDVTKTDIGPVSCIQSILVGGNQQELVVVGGQDGRVLCLHPEGEGGYRVLGWAWTEADLLSVSNITMVAGREEGKDLVLTKGSFCLILPIQVREGNVEMGDPRTLHTGLTRIVGLEVIEDSVFLASQRGPVRVWNLHTGESKVQLGVDSSHYMRYGLTTSPNRSIFVTLESIATFNDHLIMREPGRLVFWTRESADSLHAALLEPGNFRPDHMEALRVLRIADKVDMEPDYECSRDLVQCRLDWWLLSNLLGRRKGEGRVEETVEQCEIVLRSQAATRLLRQSPLCDSALLASASFLLFFSSDPSLVAEAKAAIASSTSSPWQCRLCPSPSSSPSQAVDSITCSLGHTWPRCLLTQEAVMTTHLLVCRWCKASALPCSDPPPCTLCLGPLAPCT